MEKSKSNKELGVVNQNSYTKSSHAKEILPDCRALEMKDPYVFQFNYLKEELEKQSHDT